MRIVGLVAATLFLSITATRQGELFAQESVAWPRFVPSSFQLYYGDDQNILKTMMQRMKTGQLVVVETRSLGEKTLQELTGLADTVGAKLVGYLSVGELGAEDVKRFAEFVASREGNQTGLVEEISIKKNPDFGSVMVDVKFSIWQEWVFSEADRIEALGLGGLFLDTVDTADVYLTKREWSLERRQESVEAMMGLIRRLKSRASTVPGRKNRQRFIIQNRGLNLIGKTVFVGNATGKTIPGMAFEVPRRDNPDAILWENAFTATGDWGKLKKRELTAIRKTGATTVVTLGYEATFKDRSRFFELSNESGFVPSWATSSRLLHRELTQGQSR